jgi:hypothetical protein
METLADAGARKNFWSGSTYQNIVKIVAIVCMVLDHFPYMFPDYHEAYTTFPTILCHMAGRITAPVFFYFIAVGYHRTSNVNRYCMRLLIFALLSYFPYIWYFYGFDLTFDNYTKFNVIFTMLFGLLMLRAYYEVKNIPLKIILMALCCVLAWPSDYTVLGVILIFAMDRYSSNRLKLAISCPVIVFLYGVIEYIVYYRDDGIMAGISSYFAAYTLPDHLITLCYILPVFFILPMVGTINPASAKSADRPRLSPFWKWLFYVFYPAHLTALLVIKLIFVDKVSG